MLDGGVGLDACGGPEGVAVEQGLGVGGKVGDCSGGGVEVENIAGHDMSLLRTSESICVA